jgi:hypothetical protein
LRAPSTFYNNKDNSLASGSVKEQRDQSGGPGTGAVVGQEGVLELVLAHHVFGELHVEFVLGPEDLDVLGHVRGEVLHRPRPQDRVLVLEATTIA